jgi:phospholipid/cholesterol/gamma-HCH transport system permease protein
MGNYFFNFGNWFITKINKFISLSAYSALILKTLFLRKKGIHRTSLSVLFRQVLFTGVLALPVIAMVSLAIGGISIIQSLTYLPKIGGEAFIGKLLVTIIVRELSPLLTGFIVIGRSGTAITAEIGNMVVSHEIQALEAMGIDPVQYLVIPRIMGVTVSLISLNIYFNIFSIMGGFLVSKMVLVTSFSTFMLKIAESIALADITVNIVKGLVFGILISLICTFEGFSVKLSSTEVPRVTTSAVVNAITAVFLADGLITVIYYI